MMTKVPYKMTKVPYTEMGMDEEGFRHYTAGRLIAAARMSVTSRSAELHYEFNEILLDFYYGLAIKF